MIRRKIGGDSFSGRLPYVCAVSPQTPIADLYVGDDFRKQTERVHRPERSASRIILRVVKEE